MRKAVCLLLVATFLAAGCTGSFVLTKNVYQFHRSQEDKWMDEVIFLGAVILPVYTLATLGDAIVFNVIEFWTDENPLTAQADSDIRVVENGDMRAILTHMKESDAVKLEASSSTLIFERSDSGVVAKDESGNTLYSAVTDTTGHISVYDGQGNLIQSVER